MIGRFWSWLIPAEPVLRFMDATGLRAPIERLARALNDWLLSDRRSARVARAIFRIRDDGAVEK